MIAATLSSHMSKHLKPVLLSLFLTVTLTLELKANHNSMPNTDTLIVELEPTDDFQKRLHEVFQHKYLKNLIINLDANKGWLLFPTGPKQLGTEPVYELSHEVGSLPNELAGMDSLERFSISFLGLSDLPESLTKLISLKELNISFNKIDFDKEIEKLIKLDQLEVLIVYGCGMREEHLLRLRAHNPKLEVLYNRQQYREGFTEDFGNIFR